jgi:hypothetical protein
LFGQEEVQVPAELTRPKSLQVKQTLFLSEEKPSGHFITQEFKCLNDKSEHLEQLIEESLHTLQAELQGEQILRIVS